jgi:hypothetical protein
VTRSRFRMLVLASVAAVAAVSLTACGSSSSATNSTNPPSPSTATSTDSTTEAITQAWTTFFDGSAAAATKIPLLQNGQTFASVLEAQAQSPLAKGSTAQVTSVTMDGSDKATVNYSIVIGGTPALADQTGTALLSNGQWQVADASFCSLLALEGSKVPACSS